MSRNMKDNMVKNPFVVNPQKNVKDALILMKELEIRHLPVIDTQGKILGVVSERDLRETSALPQKSILKVGDIMKTDLHLAKPNTPLRDALTIMAEQRLGCTVVVNDKQQPVGIFTTTDALYMLCGFVEDETIGTVFSRENLASIAYMGI